MCRHPEVDRNQRVSSATGYSIFLSSHSNNSKPPPEDVMENHNMTDLIMYEMDEHVIKRVFLSLRFPTFC